ncbi:hypothetical protein F4801DRAFT_70656 [Xylaria longipes]|nr:hypothetical protein F4801DRAFT_70656 [Xylaria longipes]RYC57124.1 hypothetical protein CHU98_g9077 [Xylaria longipes]
MTTHVTGAGRPTLAPLWTNYQLGRATAFRAAQGPLLSPSPMSPSRLPSPMYSTSDGFARKKDKTLGNSRVHKVSHLSVSSPRVLASIEGQSPLVSKLEKISLQLTALKSPPATEGDAREAQTRRKLRPREDFGNAATADAFIIARSIRRNGSPTTSTSNPFWEDESPKSQQPNRLTLRAIIRPKAPGRKTFLMQRNLDVDELRAAASTTPPDQSDNSASPSKMTRKPLPVPAKWSSYNRRPSAGLSSPQAERSSKIMSHSTDYDKLVHDSKTVPIHTQYIMSTLPALATLLTSGHIHSGDVVYLPIPHAESWSQTVRFIYTGEGELTTAMRENILYLGGRV